MERLHCDSVCATSQRILRRAGIILGFQVPVESELFNLVESVGEVKLTIKTILEQSRSVVFDELQEGFIPTSDQGVFASLSLLVVCVLVGNH